MYSHRIFPPELKAAAFGSFLPYFARFSAKWTSEGVDYSNLREAFLTREVRRIFVKSTDVYVT